MEIPVMSESESSFSANENLATHNSYQLEDVAANRIQAVKSLTGLLMREIELLESLKPKSDEYPKDEEISLAQAVKNFEMKLIRSALFKTRGHQRNAARLLKVKVTTLNEKMKRYGIDQREFAFFDSEYSN